MNATPNLPELRVPAPGTGDDFIVPEPDLYTIVIGEVLEVRPKVYKGKVDPDKFQVRLQFQIVGGEFDGVWWKQWVGYSLHEKAFLRQVLLAIRDNQPLDETQPVELLDYLNRPFRGMVDVDAVSAREDPTRTLRFAKVTKATPLKRASNRRAAPPPPPAADPAEDDPFAEELDEA